MMWSNDSSRFDAIRFLEAAKSPALFIRSNKGFPTLGYFLPVVLHLKFMTAAWSIPTPPIWIPSIRVTLDRTKGFDLPTENLSGKIDVTLGYVSFAILWENSLMERFWLPTAGPTIKLHQKLCHVALNNLKSNTFATKWRSLKSDEEFIIAPSDYPDFKVGYPALLPLALLWNYWESAHAKFQTRAQNLTGLHVPVTHSPTDSNSVQKLAKRYGFNFGEKLRCLRQDSFEGFTNPPCGFRR